jgi:tetratricopeptide (TPR) repeat protein
MGHLWLQVLPAEGGDQRAKLQESLVRQRLEKYPDDFGANYTMGDLLLTQGDAAGAAAHFEKASKADPRSALAATEWGIALFSASRLPEAEEQFKHALEIDPSYTDARFDLASVEAARAEWEPAAADFRRVMLERPEDARARQHLGEVLVLWGDGLFKAGRHEEALARYRGALELRPGDAQLHGKTGAALAQLARLDEAQAEFETALRIDPKSEPARQTLEVLKLMKTQK